MRNRPKIEQKSINWLLGLVSILLVACTVEPLKVDKSHLEGVVKFPKVDIRVYHGAHNPPPGIIEQERLYPPQYIVPSIELIKNLFTSAGTLGTETVFGSRLDPENGSPQVYARSKQLIVRMNQSVQRDLIAWRGARLLSDISDLAKGKLEGVIDAVLYPYNQGSCYHASRQNTIYTFAAYPEPKVAQIVKALCSTNVGYSFVETISEQAFVPNLVVFGDYSLTPQEWPKEVLDAVNPDYIAWLGKMYQLAIFMHELAHTFTFLQKQQFITDTAFWSRFGLDELSNADRLLVLIMADHAVLARAEQRVRDEFYKENKMPPPMLENSVTTSIVKNPHYDEFMQWLTKLPLEMTIQHNHH